jgi:hypothetical protein
MKKLISFLVLVLLLAGARPLAAQDWPEEYLGLPGDNLNLYAVMNLFQESETLEGFERSLNDPKTMINNLDLNGNNLVDYIQVNNYVDDNFHSIVLQVALNQNEYQDVAVFTVEKLRDGSVQIQLIGDEALYGPNYIIEPIYTETANPGYVGNVKHQKVKTRRNVTVVRTTYYEVASWPVITYIYRPSYRVYRSSWGWGYYPSYWAPWAPSYWHYYYGYHYNHYNHYYAYYRPWNHYRCDRYHTVYHRSMRNYSPTVVVNINKGSYKNTYSRPDKRKEGEVLYAQRRASGATTVPARGTSSNSAEVRQSAGQDKQLSPRAVRPASEARPAPVRSDSREAKAVRQNTEVNRGQKEAPKANRISTPAVAPRAATPSKEAVTRPAVQTNRPSKNQAVAQPKRESSATPARSVERVQSERKTPAVNNREKPKTAAVQRPQAARQVNKAATNTRVAEKPRSSNSGAAVEKSSAGNKRSSGSDLKSNTRKQGR